MHHMDIATGSKNSPDESNNGVSRAPEAAQSPASPEALQGVAGLLMLIAEAGIMGDPSLTPPSSIEP